MLGLRVNNFEIVRQLGAGGMGTVYEAEHLFFRRRVAVKVLRSELAMTADLVQRFFNEARATSAIRHPNIVEVVDVGMLPDGVPYLVMELLEGENLGDRLARVKRLPIAGAVELAWQAASALEAAHEKGIVHRDLKPDNLFLVPDPRRLDGERVKVLDFGIAKLRVDPGSAPVHTMAGALFGTPPYMAPEQCRGLSAEIDQRTDIYALGVILYESLCGQRPFVADSVVDLMLLHLSAEPIPPSERCQDLPPELERTVLKALAKRPDDRFATMAEFSEALAASASPLQHAGAATSAEKRTSHGPDATTDHARAALPAPHDVDARPRTALPHATTAPLAGVGCAPSERPWHHAHTIPQPGKAYPGALPAHSGSFPAAEFERPAHTAQESPAPRVGLAARWRTWGWTATRPPQRLAAAFGLAFALLAASVTAWLGASGRAPAASSREHSDITETAQGHVAAASHAAPAPGSSSASSGRTDGDSHSAPRDPASAAPAAQNDLERKQAITGQAVDSAIAGKASAPTQAGRTLAGSLSLPTDSTSQQPFAERAASSQIIGTGAQPVVAPSAPAPRGDRHLSAAVSTPTTPAHTVQADAPGHEQPVSGAAADDALVEPGYLSLDSAPWSDVFLAGKLLGTTPLVRVPLPPGKHLLMLKNPELGASTTYVVEIRSGATLARMVGWE